MKDRKFKDLTGQTFGRLTVLNLAYRVKPNRYWECACVCGNKAIVRGTKLGCGETISCGCYGKERALAAVTKHGHSSGGKLSLTYRSWRCMIGRCTLACDPCFKHYGARGIKICDRWLHSFENFLSDMGERTEGLTLDRINNNGNYEPGNCRWATWKQQANNKRTKKECEEALSKMVSI